MTVGQLTFKTALKLEKLKEKWSGFTRGIILAIAEEEMRISREEFRPLPGSNPRSHLSKSESDKPPDSTHPPCHHVPRSERPRTLR